MALGDPEDRLRTAIQSAREVDWDGYGALPASDDAAETAHAFLNALPLRAQVAADIEIDPDGEVLFEWATSAPWLLTLAIDERGRIAYSGLFGSSRCRGIDTFDGAVPDLVAHAIARVLDRKENLEEAPSPRSI